MKKYILPLTAALAVAGCGNTAPVATTTGTAAPAPTNLATITAADLTQAIAEAQAATPPDTEAVACFQFVQTNLSALQGQVGAVQAPVGVFSAFETANLALNNGVTALGPNNKTAAETACGPLVLHVQNAAATGAAEVVAILAGLGIKVAVPAALAVK